MCCVLRAKIVSILALVCRWSASCGVPTVHGKLWFPDVQQVEQNGYVEKVVEEKQFNEELHKLQKLPPPNAIP
jgi:hypothetical protein